MQESSIAVRNRYQALQSIEDTDSQQYLSDQYGNTLEVQLEGNKNKNGKNWVKSHVIMLHQVWKMQHFSNAIKTELEKYWVLPHKIQQVNVALVKTSIIFLHSGAIKTN